MSAQSAHSLRGFAVESAEENGPEKVESEVQNASDPTGLGPRRVNDQIRLRSSDRMSDATPTSVYRYYDRGGLLLYVGITSRNTTRQREHNGDKEWWQFVARQDVEHFATRTEAASREASLIRNFRPPFNKQHNPHHAEMRELYLAVSQAGPVAPLTASAATMLGKIKHKLPLSTVSRDESHVVLSANTAHRQLTAVLTWPYGVPLVGAPNKKKIGTLVEHTMMGDALVLTFVLRKAAPHFAGAQGNVKAKGKPFTPWLHSVEVA